MNKDLLFKIPVMTIGAAGALASAYSVVTDGNAKAKVHTKDELGTDYLDMYVKNNSSSKESHLLEKVKNYVLEQKMDNTFYSSFIRSKNHATSFVAELAENIIPISLSAIILSSPKLFKNKITRNVVSGASATILLLEAGKIFVHDVLGKGKTVDY